MKTLLAISLNLLFLAIFFVYQNNTLLAWSIGISVVIWFFYFLWKRQKLVEKRLADAIKNEKVIIPVEQVMFRAIESSGYSQASGLGYIALTESCLHFEFTLIDMPIKIPVDQLIKTEIVSRLKGVSPGKKMLRIVFNNSAGNQDSIAINPKNMALWKKQIDRLCQKIS